MPGRDGTGPLGNGTVFGRRMGYCNVVNPTLIGCGLGLGLGLGMGFRGGRNSVPAFQQKSVATNQGSTQIGLSQKEILEEQKRLLETRLKMIEDRLENFKEDA